MHIVIAYATLSGSTMTVADVITAVLKSAGHDVTAITADIATPDMLKPADMLVLGSPSWEDEGKDGQPLPEVRKFVESLAAEDVAGKKVALFGLGDTTYPHFCGAIDVLEEKLKAIAVTPAVPSLKIDRYYSTPDNEQKVKDWAALLARA